MGRATTCNNRLVWVVKLGRLMSLRCEPPSCLRSGIKSESDRVLFQKLECFIFPLLHVYIRFSPFFGVLFFVERVCVCLSYCCDVVLLTPFSVQTSTPFCFVIFPLFIFFLYFPFLAFPFLHSTLWLFVNIIYLKVFIDIT